MRIEQLQYLVETADCGSITIAAERLHISQPSVSQSITSLEEELQTTIFVRSRLGTRPTETGKLIIEKARNILNQVGDIRKIAENQNSQLTGTIYITTIPSMCVTLLPKTLAVFKSKFQNVHVEIIESGSRKAHDDVLNGHVDLGLICTQSMDYDEKLTFERLITGETMVCVGKQFPLPEKRKITLQEMIKYPIVIFNQEYWMNPYILGLLAQYGDPNILFTASNPESLKKVIAEGLAAGFYADFALKIDPYVHNGDIIPLHITEHNMKTFFGVLHKKQINAAAEEFIKELRTQAINFKMIYNLTE
ncbi:LysR family transcriptional regulator [Neobacillus sp. 114]|uniref:LysR family transcriptional regulator n=1 Tax=Neobacillus sp. 114 TaxID=3048535 RepID=UPI0024C34E31|nr:LysR family transcriptional regulator [Neobacillus sp. 114]